MKRTDITVEEIVQRRLVRSVYQPIVELSTRAVVGYEALARGPQGSALERPDQLFAAARDAGIEAELDAECRAAAIEGALAGGLAPCLHLFINVEPAALSAPTPPRLAQLYETAAAELNVVIEVTERKLDADPAGVIGKVAAMRDLGFAVALDDVGADPMSLAFLPLLAPDVIKLDMNLIRDPMCVSCAEINAAVRSDAELRGATILGEGIEDAEYQERAAVFGATLGQGWHFGRPGNIPAEAATIELDAPCIARNTMSLAETPWSLVADFPEIAVAPKRLLMSMSNHIEQMAHSANDRPVVFGAFQDARFFTPKTAERYRKLVPASTMVAALGTGMPETPADGVRGAGLPKNDRLADEWVVITVSPHRAAALIAKDLGDDGPDSERRFAYMITHDRSLVGAAARSMMQHLLALA